MILSENQLKRIYPAAPLSRIQLFITPLSAWMNYYEINTPARATAFLAQIGHESGQLKYTEEIASGAAYEGRKDLGNTQPGDGIRFKGRGLIQITGRANYEQISGDTGMDFIEHPELLEQPEYAAMSACWFWDSMRLNIIADKPDGWIKTGLQNNYNKLQWITIKINGGLNGLADRLAIYNRAKTVLNTNV